MLKCRDAARLLSAQQDQALPWRENLHLGMHLAMCKRCRRFKAQMAFLRVAGKRYAAR